MIPLYPMIRILFISTILIPIIALSIYGIILIYYHRKPPIYTNNVKFFPELTILLPTHNEEKIIEKRIENLFTSEYPSEKIRVVFIDDSSDSTTDIIQKNIDRYNNLSLIRFNQRMGYSQSILAGIKKSNTDIIVLNEAGSFPREDALLRLASHFKNPNIGAVTGKSELLNTKERVGGMEDVYLRIVNFIRESESKMDSTFYIKGEATAYRRELVSGIEAIPKTGSIDTSMAFLVRKRGFKSIYDPKVVFNEYAPSDDEGYIKQKSIRAANWMRNLIIYKDMLFNRKYGKFGFITLPFNVFALFVMPLLSIVSLSTILMGLILDTAFFTNIAIIIVIMISVLTLISRKLVPLLLELEVSLLKALYQIFVSKTGHDKIERVESTRRAL